MDKCEICGHPQKDDLFAWVTQEPVCSICVVSFDMGSPVSKKRIATIREALGLADGEYYQQDRADVARRALGRR